MAMTLDPIDLLARLIGCRSDRQEEAMVGLLADLLRSWGASIRVETVAPGRPNLIATFAGADPGRSLILEAHADTVGGDAPYAATVRDGRVYGRGACDTKGPMTAMLLGIRSVLDRNGRPPVTLYFISTCNEELGATGAHALMASGFRADAAVVAEPTDLAIVHAHKGALRLRLRTRGVAAHSSQPDRGVNAIYKMRRVLEAIETRVVPGLARKRDPVLGSPSVSIGTIRGGTQVNVVPDWCEIEVDRRLVAGETSGAAAAEIVAAAGEVEHELTEYYPRLGEDPAGPLATRVAGACRATLGAARLVTAPWGSNAGVFHAAGIPSVLIGPGSIAQAHTREEYLEVEQLRRAIPMYEAIIRAFE